MSILLKRLFHRKISSAVQAYFAVSKSSETTAGDASAERKETMPKTIRELLSDARATDPRYVRLHNSEYSARELLSEILSMANRIGRKVSDAQLSSSDRRMWGVRELASKWDSIKAYPEMLQDVDIELLKILVLDAYADMERLESSGR